MKKQLAIIMLVFVSLGAAAQHGHESHPQEKGPSFKDEKLGSAYRYYTHLKDALVASNAGEAKQAAGELQKSLVNVANSKKPVDAAKTIATSSDLNNQRKSFSNLSNEMTSLIKASKLASGTLYVEYCPMANNNEGAFWLSNEMEIKNHISAR